MSHNKITCDCGESRIGRQDKGFEYDPYINEFRRDHSLMGHGGFEYQQVPAGPNEARRMGMD